jgi:hypothetical protein
MLVCDMHVLVTEERSRELRSMGMGATWCDSVYTDVCHKIKHARPAE